MLDFATAKPFLLSTLSTKFAFFEPIPFKLTGLAHWCEESAQNCALQCVAQSQAGGKDHRLSDRFLSPEGQLREQVDRFGLGEPLNTLLELEAEVSQLRFIFMTERSVERLHAIGTLNTRSKPHHSQAFRSLALRSVEIAKRIDSDKTCFTQMCNHMMTTKKPVGIAGALGLASHPHIQSHAQELTMPIVMSVVYHCDLTTMFDARDDLAAGMRKTNKLTRQGGHGSGVQRDAPAAIRDAAAGGVAGLVHPRAEQRSAAPGLLVRKAAMGQLRLTASNDERP